MSRFGETFANLARQGRTGLMPYVTAGDPSLEWTERLIDQLVAAGADMIELGVPYSDPLADGPTVQAAGQRALAAGTTVRGVFETVKRLRTKHPRVPIALLVYYNCIYRWGEERFVAAAKESGVDAFVVPDLPPEEATSLQAKMADCGLDLAYLLAPTSTEERIALVVERASGFIYCVSLTGVTGARTTLSAQLEPFMARVRAQLGRAARSIPLVVGFGISTVDHVRQVAPLAEGVIVGSALIDMMARAATPADGVARCAERVAEMAQALRSVPGAAARSPQLRAQP